MGPKMEIRTRQYSQNAQNFGPELLDQVRGPKITKKVPKYAQAALGCYGSSKWPGPMGPADGPGTANRR